LAFVRKCWNDCTAFLTICGGIEVPRLAGLLDGVTATGPRTLLPMLRQQSPATNWVEKRWVRDGKLWTSGALLNGTDMMHNFTDHFWGGHDNSLPSLLSKVGAWPSREIDYKDVPWAL
jgi:transcriptional regulator GlxA family with amidase domain